MADPTPPAAAPPAPADDPQPVALGLTVAQWHDEIERARKLRKDVAERQGWEKNLERYAPSDIKTTTGRVNIGADFADVERKKTALFYAQPDIALVCDEPSQPLTPPQPPQPGAPPPPPGPTLGSLVMVHQALLNEVLGPSQINAKGVVHKCLLNVLLTAGCGPVKVGFRSVSVPVDTPVMDSATGQPQIGPDGMPVTEVTPISIHDEFYASALSPMALLLPPDFRDTDVRYASWIGYDFKLPASRLIAELRLPADTEFPGATEKPYFHADAQNGSDEAHDRLVSGSYIEYRASLENPYAHPEAVKCMWLVDGMDDAVKSGDSPNQTIDEMGVMTPDSVPGFSILPLWIRDLPDSAWVPADSTITGPLTLELNKFRTQAIEQRDTARNIILYDPTKVTVEAKAKIDDGTINTWVAVPPGALDQGKDAIAVQVSTAQLGRESYLGQDYIQADRDRILGISANQQGAQTSTERSATEVSAMQRNSDARFNHEQNRVIEWYLAWVRLLDAFLLRYADERFATRLLGPQKGAFWAQHKPALLGGYRHTIQADSGKYVDIEATRRQFTQLYQMTRQDPLLNPRPVLEKLFAAHGIDPSMAIIAEPPKAEPTPPQAAFTFKGEDLNPLMPQFELVLAIITLGGWKIPPEAIEKARGAAQIAQLIGEPVVPQGGAGAEAGMEAQHGGPAKQQLPLSKRQEDETGGRSGPKVDA